MPIEEIVKRIDHARAVRPRRKFKSSYIARCPAHDDRSPSLSIDEAQDGRILINCHAGCGALDVLDAIGLDWADLFPPDGEYLTGKRNVSREAVDSIVVEIAEHDRALGKRLTRADKERYRAALKRESKRSDTITEMAYEGGYLDG